ncbi:MAG: FAD-dependent oxidoreductase [Candidatus Hydrogenedens sp.]|nr:FAD-dependent oxidoreductase [Candidatus Hydrogenedens sp.]
MDRGEMLGRLRANPSPWDVIVVGGGATGLGVAIDAASRGYATLLLEQSDFAKGTSSRSTKLVHGGVRYLQQGNVSLVLEALRERGILRDNAPHLVHDLPFVVPNYDWWEAPFYGVGLRLYDALAGKHGFGPSRNLSKAKTIDLIPTIEQQGLRGGVIYYDGQFDDARLAVNMAQTAADQGATLLNYARVTGLLKAGGEVCGVQAADAESGETFELQAKVVVNATGVFTDSVRHMDDPDAKRMVRPSQGIHLVLPSDFLPGNTAIMVPHTDDGRVLFAIPWHGRTVVGTTDTPVEEESLEPRPLDEEVEFLLAHAARYLSKDPVPSDVLSVFAGLRPLVGSGDDENTATISRDHTISISRSGLVTITGGKWTTYRKMAEDTVDHAMAIGRLPERECVTRGLRLHGYHQNAAAFGGLATYGSDAPRLKDFLAQDAGHAEQLHPRLACKRGEVVWAARHEMARTVDDFLARRTRSLLLDARASIEAAPEVARLLGEALGNDAEWQQQQAEAFCSMARGYVLGAA